MPSPRCCWSLVATLVQFVAKVIESAPAALEFHKVQPLICEPVTAPAAFDGERKENGLPSTARLPSGSTTA
jgi:hypothetical protein